MHMPQPLMADTASDHSSKVALSTPGLAMTFIRAPRISAVGAGVEVLATYEGEPVLVRQGRILAATFHPELTSDACVYRYWTVTVTVEATGSHDKLEALVRVLEPFGIKELVKSGTIALGRGGRSITDRTLRPLERSA